MKEIKNISDKEAEQVAAGKAISLITTVKCEKCGKKFVAPKNVKICPKCASGEK